MVRNIDHPKPKMQDIQFTITEEKKKPEKKHEKAENIHI